MKKLSLYTFTYDLQSDVEKKRSRKDSKKKKFWGFKNFSVLLYISLSETKYARFRHVFNGNC